MLKAYVNLLKNKTKLSVIGMGYVGLPIAVAFDQKVNVVGFDINRTKIQNLTNNIDETGEVGEDNLSRCHVEFTYQEETLQTAKIHIVAVPTPIKDDTTPDLDPLINASELLARNLMKDSVIIFESTVYPGVTEDICVPIIEKTSGLKAGLDFKVGYSPERINPGDKIHRLETITKVVSGMDKETVETVAAVYELVVAAGVYKAKSIKVAEAAKVIENAQRDINIAFVNELSIIFDRMNINTSEVLEAASTKWNFLNFYPGLVGGHCIGVDPYYLTYRAKQLGYDSKIINSGRSINDAMGRYIAQKIVKLMLKNHLNVAESKVGIFGFTFKENCPDIRNTKVIDIYEELQSFGVLANVFDPLADSEKVKRIYSVDLMQEKDLMNLDVAVFAVSHDCFKEYNLEKIQSFFSDSKKNIIIDIKSIYKNITFKNFTYWSL